jgi:peptidoglycan/xylan/chitin deacetylase (PgdA/CDA1 family)
MHLILPTNCGKNIRTFRALPALAAFVLSAWCMICAAFGATVPGPYELATWRGFRASAVSYTFDDNSPKQFSVAQPMLDAKGLPATFFCIVGNLSSSEWTVIENASAKGHEIGSHTLTHPDLTTLTDVPVTIEESDSKNLIESHTGKKCVSLAYPYCAVPQRSITSQYYPFARSCNGSLVPATPPDFLSIGALGPETDMNTASDSAASSGRWLVWLIHGIDDDPACCPTGSQVLKLNLDYVAGGPDKWWVETFGNVCRYIQERNAAVLTVVSEESTVITLRLTHNLDGTVFNYPLTLRRPMPSGWVNAAVTQNGVLVPSRIVNGNLMFDVVPNGGDIVLAKGEPTPTYGWNLGNTLEPPGGEGAWGPTATQKLINAVADAGFNTVRLPVFLSCP